MGLRASIYKSKGKSFSNGGISERYDDVTIVNAEGPFEPTDDAPAVLIVKGNLPGTVKAIMAAEATGPGAAIEYHGKWAPLIPDGVGPMMGGCYVDTSDSRLGEVIAKLIGGQPAAHGPVPLHDRYESAALYAANSY